MEKISGIYKRKTDHFAGQSPAFNDEPELYYHALCPIKQKKQMANLIPPTTFFLKIAKSDEPRPCGKRLAMLINIPPCATTKQMCLS